MLWNELLRLFFYIGIAIPVEEYFDSHTTAVGGSAGQSEEVEIDFSPCTWCFYTKILYEFLILLIDVTCSTNLISSSLISKWFPQYFDIHPQFMRETKFHTHIGPMQH